MNKLNSKLIKLSIVTYLNTHPGIIKRLFAAPYNEQINENELCKVVIWKRISKETYKGKTTRCFAPFGSKQESIVEHVQAIVTTIDNDSIIESISIEG
jgi:hypothetical protein